MSTSHHLHSKTQALHTGNVRYEMSSSVLTASCHKDCLTLSPSPPALSQLHTYQQVFSTGCGKMGKNANFHQDRINSFYMRCM